MLFTLYHSRVRIKLVRSTNYTTSSNKQIDIFGYLSENALVVPIVGNRKESRRRFFFGSRCYYTRNLPLPLQPFAEVVKVDVDIGEVFNQAGVSFGAGVVNGVRD